MRLATPLLALFVGLHAWAQPTPCPENVEVNYEGPCFYDALPAFFDDFEYASARTTGSVAQAPEGDLFGTNVWHTRGGKEQTRAWYRYNRDDLPLPGSITFDSPSTISMRLPEGLTSEDFDRSSIIHAGFTSRDGTYVWRVQLSEQRPGQRLRQSIWTMSGNAYAFDQPGPNGETRLMFWSELDFENENHFQGERRNGVFIPDYVTRMSVGNHYGRLWSPEGSRRLGSEGTTGWMEGRGILVRNGMARGEAARDALLIPSWAGVWLYLIIHVDAEAQTVTYRMAPDRQVETLTALQDVAFTAGSAFYPLQRMFPAFSLHWVEPEGLLRQTLSLESDWFYYSPVADLSVEDVREQVQHLRQRDLVRLNTTDLPTFQDYAPSHPIQPAIQGPHQVACGAQASWTIDVQRLGRYFITYRYRFLRTDGSYGSWKNIFEPTFSYAPKRGWAGIEFELTAKDLWVPNGVVRGPSGQHSPHSENDQAATSLTARFDC